MTKLQSDNFILNELQPVVQRNCHISDALHASNYTLCVYLLKMREYYRWEQHLSLDKTLDKGKIGRWLSQRERFWESLEDVEYSNLPLQDACFDPFSSDAINRQLISQGFVYSAGYGVHSKPIFFLARLDRTVTEGDKNIYISSHEFARDLTAPPAMSLGNSIFIRKESLQRMLWEKIDEWRWNRLDNAMGRAIGFYDFDNAFETSLSAMTENEITTLILHESGEVLAGSLIEDGWHEMLASSKHPQVELVARAVRDHLADALTTLPALIETASPSLHFYMANLTGMRKHLIPSILNAYNGWLGTGNIDALSDAVSQGEIHWLTQANRLIEVNIHRQTPVSLEEMEHLIADAIL
ncbi:MAG: Sfum_1244 family protein [Gammaproteobacteria bacterium]